MPIYSYICEKGHRFTRFLTVANHRRWLSCECGVLAEQVITAPLMVKACADVCYDSPIDGKPITSWAAREEDLKRNNCRPYDPEMKTDYQNRIKEADAKLDQAVEATVEEFIEKLPTQKRGQLQSELLDQSFDTAYARSTKEV